MISVCMYMYMCLILNVEKNWNYRQYSLDQKGNLDIKRKYKKTLNPSPNIFYLPFCSEYRIKSGDTEWIENQKRTMEFDQINSNKNKLPNSYKIIIFFS
jgi:hypothetical protein